MIDFEGERGYIGGILAEYWRNIGQRKQLVPIKDALKEAFESSVRGARCARELFAENRRALPRIAENVAFL